MQCNPFFPKGSTVRQPLTSLGTMHSVLGAVRIHPEYHLECIACVCAAHVSGCSGVSLLPSAALGAAKIKIMGGADVTNQTALYPGVTVKPGAVLGVFTYAEAGRTFPRNSITQVSPAAGHCSLRAHLAPKQCKPGPCVRFQQK